MLNIEPPPAPAGGCPAPNCGGEVAPPNVGAGAANVEDAPPPKGLAFAGAAAFLESGPPKLNTPLGAGGL